MIHRRQKPPARWPILVLFFVISISAVIISFIYYNYQKKALLTEKQQELSAISYLKIRQITQWRLERIGDGRFLGENSLFVRRFSEYLKNPDNTPLRNDILQSLKLLTETYDYKSASIIENSGEIILDYPGRDTVTGNHLKPFLQGIIEQRKILLTDLHTAGSDSFVHLDLVVPLIDKIHNDTVVLGLMVLQVDPQQVFYPLIQSWPAPSRSAETLILRREGDEIVYLNELRHLRNSALKLKRPVTTKDLPAALAVQGIRGTIDGIDYRKVRVVAAMNKIPGTQWYMVAKVDRDEILSVLDYQKKLIIIILILLIITSGSFLGFLIRNQRVVYYREKYESELVRLAEREIAENTLKESENRFRKIFEESPFPILMTGKDFGILRANSAFCNLIGYKEEDLKSLTFRNFTHPDYIANDEISLLNLVAGEIPLYHTEKRYICSNGSVIWGSTSVSLIRNKLGEVQFFLVMIEDITSRKKAAFELSASVSLLRATLESTEDGLLVVDFNGKIVQYNKKFAEMWKIPEEVLAPGEDSKLLEYVQSELLDPESFLAIIEHLYSNPEATSFDLLEFTDGRFFERYSQPQTIDGESVGRVWSFRDITQRKKAEAELIAAKEKAEESDRLKTAFLHNVSHEIRTPMNAIIGFSSLLNEPDLSEDDRHQYIDIIFQSGGQLLSIINDIVDIANVESGQAKINLTEINLNTKLKSLNEQFSINGKLNNVVINLETTLPDKDSIIVTDNTKLVQILSNLINNAIKFTSNGQVKFGYVLKDRFLEFFVKDTGIGIPPEYHDRIFERFYQVDSTISRQYNGTGLGLSICKGYVELLGGTINVKSETGKGTLFLFTIPYLPGKLPPGITCP